jgi:hypothetical protein
MVVFMRFRLSLVALLFVAGCGSDPDARQAPEEDRLTAKAVSDVDAAMAEARGPAAAKPAAPAK